MARIALIGAGMGALAAAARLAAGGHRVAVFERSATYGGGVGRYERDGFAFDTGPALLHLPAVYRDLFIKTGRERLEQSVTLTQVDPASRHVFADGTAVSLPNASRAGVVAALDEAFGAGVGERWSEVMGRARQVWEATRRPLLEDALAAGVKPSAEDPYPAAPVRRGLFRRGAPTLAEAAARELRDPRPAALLESYASAYGLVARAAPASAVVLAYLEQTFGAWYVGGGMRALADAVHARCLARGVEFRFGEAVTGVLEKNGRAAGVGLAGGHLAEADIVVAGIAPARLNALFRGSPGSLREGRGPWTPGEAGPGPSSGASAGRLTVCLALRGSRPADAVHRTVLHAADPRAEQEALLGGALCDRPTVTVLRPDDAALRPDDAHEAVTLTVPVPPHGPVDWARTEVAGAFADRVTAVAEAAVPGLRGRILWREVRTPADTERETGADGGAVPAPALAGRKGAFLHPANVRPLPGLYTVGGWAHPGGGLAHAGMSGAIVADLIAGGPGGSR